MHCLYLICLRTYARKNYAPLGYIKFWGGEVLPIMAYRGRLRPKGGYLYQAQVYEKVGIFLVEVYERVGKSVIFNWVYERA